MLGVRWQALPLSGDGAAINGGRWNRRGCPALYLAADHATAIAEFYQNVVRPGTLAGYDVHSAQIADLTNAAHRRRFGVTDASLLAPRKTLAEIERADPPGWDIADRLIADGAHGALVPSAAHLGGTNLVLWRWSADGGDGASVRLLDPLGDLAG